MKIKLNIREYCVFDNNDSPQLSFIRLIKQIREDIGLSLRDAKQLADYAKILYQNGERESVTIDLSQNNDFNYLANNSYLNDPNWRKSMVAVEVVSQTEEAAKCLKSAVIKLLEDDHYEDALDVLTVLIRLEN